MAEHNRGMEAGDRIPNFILVDQFGKPFEFYTSIAGGAIVIVILSGDDDGNKALLRALEERRPDLEAQNAHLYVLSNDAPEAPPALTRELDLHYPLFADPEGRITNWFLSSARATAPAVFVLDPNQRLISFHHAFNGDADALPAHALEEVAKIAPKSEPRLVTEVAPILLIPNVFSPEYCRRLIEMWKSGAHLDSVVTSNTASNQGHQINYGTKRRKDYVVDDMEIAGEIKNLLGARLGPEVQKIYYYGSWEFEPYRIGCYEDSDAGFFKAHRDNFNENLKHRRYAVSINLNAEEYEGGDLRFPEYGSNYYRPPTGGAVVFSCSLLHEVLPVTKGTRYVFLTFLNNPRAKPV